ncbi:hypothetical protein [Pseudanabaena sp. ABRG5-3]|uniref:hypothetical protein n=1 Tax=Pseudanabaena sp. ABRG5-3 TaxID=685565 RepID=UPI000DC70796|nr:hypothetical protein [Pseudanabaena sp. ABRG5-3]BBC24780.1 hypothetical protein ABRG53_2523 [Pseudanabaena sp. ABRG5-3]
MKPKYELQSVSETDKFEAIASLLALATTVLFAEKEAEDLLTQAEMPERLMAYFQGIKNLDLKTKSLISAIFAGEVAEAIRKPSKGFGKIR